MEMAGAGNDMEALQNQLSASENHKSAIKTAICRRFSAFRFQFSVFNALWSIPVKGTRDGGSSPP